MKYLVPLILLLVITACSSDDEGTMENILVQSITIEGNTITDGGSSQLTAEISPANAANKEVSWSVNNESVATISSEGLLTAVSNGNVQVTVTALDASGTTASRWMEVSGVVVADVPVEQITVRGDDISDGKPATFTADVLPVNADVKTVSWSVSDSELAEIDDDGLLTPQKNGSITVIATAQDGTGVTGEKTISISGVNEDINGTIVTTSSEFLNAVNTAQPGDSIYIREGTYAFNLTIQLNFSGTEENRISLCKYPGDERPLIDFSAMGESSSNRGFQLNGSYWYIKEIDVFAAGDNGMFIKGNNNIIEFCTFFENADSGLQIGNGGSNNTVINCDSYYNADASIENADGFACKLDAGDGNKFIGCRAWQNLDDGWDGYMRGNDNITTVHENCWAFMNGVLKNGTVGGGDGNGFKTGGSDNKDLKHNAIYYNCIAFGNVYDGFDHNSNRGDIELYNCSAQENGRNISFGSGNIAAKLVVKNSISIDGDNEDRYEATETDITNNSWQDGLEATAEDFVSLDASMLSAPRKADGSLPDIDYFHLVPGSDLIDKGVDVGLPFNGSAPDLGAFEFQP